MDISQAFLGTVGSFLGAKMLPGTILAFLGAPDPFLGTCDASLGATLLKNQVCLL